MSREVSAANGVDSMPLLENPEPQISMNDEKRQKIEELAKASHAAQERYQMLRMMNTAPTHEERERQSIEYALAQAEAIEARKALDDFISL